LPKPRKRGLLLTTANGGNTSSAGPSLIYGDELAARINLFGLG